MIKNNSEASLIDYISHSILNLPNRIVFNFNFFLIQICPFLILFFTPSQHLHFHLFITFINFSVYYLFLSSIVKFMSSKKIVRLKTPNKSKQFIKTPQQTMATNIYYNQLSTILKVENIQVSQKLQVTLINEINKLYKDIEGFKKQITQYKQLNEQLASQKKKMKSKMQLIQKQQIMFKNMYELQKQNHIRLRKFYEQREQEWIEIIEQQRKILQEHQFSNQTSLSLKSEKSLGLLSLLSNKCLEKMRDKGNNQQILIESQPKIKTENKKIARVSRKNCISQPKYIYIEDRQNNICETNKNEQNQYMIETKKQEKKKQINNLQKDEIFDLILRKIYYQNRQNQINIDQISQLEDMIKLKKAKTSTRDRLIKTLKKLSHHQNNDQIIIFCDYVEQSIINQHKILLGDLVYNFLIQKLKQCEKLALSSNSFISYIEKSKSFIIDKPYHRKIRSNEKLPNLQKLYYGQAQKQFIHKDSLLQLNSITKIAKVQSVQKEQLQQNFDQVRYSISSLRNLSELINGDTGYLLDETKMMQKRQMQNNKDGK